MPDTPGPSRYDTSADHLLRPAQPSVTFSRESLKPVGGTGHSRAFKRRRDITAHIVAKKRNSGKGWTAGFGAQFNDKTLLRRVQVDGAQKGTSSLSIHDLQEVHGRRAERFALRLALPDVRVKGSPYQHRMWSVADPAARLTQEEMGWLYEHQIFGYHDRVALKPLWDLPDASLRFKADLIEPTAGPTRIKSAKDIAIVKGAQRIIIPYDRPSRSRKSTRLFSRGSEKSVGSSRASTPLPWPLPVYTARQSVRSSCADATSYPQDDDDGDDDDDDDDDNDGSEVPTRHVVKRGSSYLLQRKMQEERRKAMGPVKGAKQMEKKQQLASDRLAHGKSSSNNFEKVEKKGVPGGKAAASDSSSGGNVKHQPQRKHKVSAGGARTSAPKPPSKPLGRRKSRRM
eukprot:g840.t1